MLYDGVDHLLVRGTLDRISEAMAAILNPEVRVLRHKLCRIFLGPVVAEVGDLASATDVLDGQL